jgi:hypothetical protein
MQGQTLHSKLGLMGAQGKLGFKIEGKLGQTLHSKLGLLGARGKCNKRV